MNSDYTSYNHLTPRRQKHQWYSTQYSAKVHIVNPARGKNPKIQKTSDYYEGDTNTSDTYDVHLWYSLALSTS
jgi:hypothetical protein